MTIRDSIKRAALAVKRVTVDPVTKPRRLRRVSTHNLQVGRGWRAAARGLRELIADQEPDAIALQEAMNYAAALRLRFALHWRFVAAPDEWAEARNCLLMVRRDVQQRRLRRRGAWGWVRNRIGWVGPKHGLRHPGRTWPWLIIDGVAVMCIHRVWNGRGKSETAYREEGEALVEWAKEHPGPVLIIGDTNTSVHDFSPGSMRSVATLVDGRLAYDPDDPGVDYALSRGLDVTVRRRKRYDSDHRSATADVRRRGDTLREALS